MNGTTYDRCAMSDRTFDAFSPYSFSSADPVSLDHRSTIRSRPSETGDERGYDCSEEEDGQELQEADVPDVLEIGHDTWDQDIEPDDLLTSGEIGTSAAKSHANFSIPAKPPKHIS